jgi:tRNA threonylcarbamoyladenosine biosynthesis protein TsaB
MLVAALDTATLTLSAALLEVGEAGAELLAERTEHQPPRVAAGATIGHGARLPAVIRDLLVACDRKLPEVEGYAIGLGPGSFTGLRIGLATFKGFSYANQRPIAGASSLASMAQAAASGAPAGALLVPLLDARRGELYAGFYRAEGGGVVAVLPDAVLHWSALLEAARQLTNGHPPAGFGEGYQAYAAELGPGLPRLATEVRTPNAAALGRLCAAALRGAAFDKDRLAALEPHYVRKSEAEVKFPDGLPPPGLPKRGGA